MTTATNGHVHEHPTEALGPACVQRQRGAGHRRGARGARHLSQRALPRPRRSRSAASTATVAGSTPACTSAPPQAGLEAHGDLRQPGGGRVRRLGGRDDGADDGDGARGRGHRAVPDLSHSPRRGRSPAAGAQPGPGHRRARCNEAHCGRAARAALTRREWRSLAGMGAVVVGLHVVGLRHPDRGRGAAPLRAGVIGRVHGRARAHRLHARPAPCLRRRSHRRDRQHHPQADGRAQAPAQRRVLVLAGALVDRVRAGAAVRRRDPRARRARAQRRLGAAPRHRPDRDRRLRRLPVRDRGAQPGHPARDPARVPRHAPRRLRRGASSSASSTPAAS